MLIVTLLLAGILIQAQVDVSFRFANAQVNSDDAGLFQFDIEMKASQLDTYQRDLQIFMDYNPKAFGSEIVKNELINVEKLELMQGDISGEDKYSFIRITDVNNADRIAILTEFTAEKSSSGPGFYNMVTTDFIGLARITIKIKNSDEKAGIKMVHKLMDGGLYYAKTDSKPYKYDKLIIDNDLIDTSLK